jgi:hypothetical protein
VPYWCLFFRTKIRADTDATAMMAKITASVGNSGAVGVGVGAVVGVVVG